MNILERIINTFYPLDERRKVRQAMDVLAPKFKLDRPAAMPTVVRSSGSYQSGNRVHIRSDVGPEVYGEEVSHYLHELVNPAFTRAVHDAHFPATRAGALDYLALRNWEECIGRLGSNAYLLERGEGKDITPTAQWGRWSRETCRDMRFELGSLRKEEEEAAYSDRRAKRISELQQEHDDYEWNLLEHLAGCRAADELMKYDPFCTLLPEFARLTPDKARAVLSGLRSWPRYWNILEKRYGDSIMDVVEKNAPDTLE